MRNSSAPIDRPFRLINKQDCPDPRLLDAYVFFETGGFVEVIRWEEFDNTCWKVFIRSPDGGH
jgi:hypothetical protein